MTILSVAYVMGIRYYSDLFKKTIPKIQENTVFGERSMKNRNKSGIVIICVIPISE